MTRKLLVLLFGLTMLVSFSAMAGHRDGYHEKHYRGHYAKHHRHHNKHYRHPNKHQGRFYSAHGDRAVRCRHRSHYRHGRYAHFHDVPRVALNVSYGYPNGGAVLVYESYPRVGRGY